MTNEEIQTYLYSAIPINRQGRIAPDDLHRIRQDITRATPNQDTRALCLKHLDKMLQFANEELARMENEMRNEEDAYNLPLYVLEYGKVTLSFIRTYEETTPARRPIYRMVKSQ